MALPLEIQDKGITKVTPEKEFPPHLSVSEYERPTAYLAHGWEWQSLDST